MGLDMYLYKNTYYQEVKSPGFAVPANIKPERVTTIIEKVGYWRKANAIHGWFVKNVQAGQDDCDEYPVRIRQLKELLDTVNKTIEAYRRDPKSCAEILPVTEGFFFGDYEYDEWYLEDLEETKVILTEALTEAVDWENVDRIDSVWHSFTYCSSW